MTHGFRTIDTASTEQRGYGWTQHRKPRADALAQLPDGSPCVRCGKPMWFDFHSPLHYDHNATRTDYLGFSHAHCNLRAGGEAGRRAQRARRQPHQHW